ncbi:MAG: hypothetical protein MZV65_53325 [Chromatiales bacterium]|nr:hypothetical protein [Chromatiales bacterium]
MPRDPRVYVEDILEAIRRIDSYTSGLDFIAFTKNPMADRRRRPEPRSPRRSGRTASPRISGPGRPGSNGARSSPSGTSWPTSISVFIPRSSGMSSSTSSRRSGGPAGRSWRASGRRPIPREGRPS